MADDKTPDTGDEGPVKEGHNPRRATQAEELLAKRSQQVHEEVEGSETDREERALESEVPGGGTPPGAPAASEEEATADQVPEYTGENIVVQGGKEYLRSPDGSLIPVEDALQGYSKMADSTRKYQEASHLMGQARQFYEEAQRLSARREQTPKLTKEEAEARAKELSDLDAQARDALLEADYETADELRQQYNTKLVELMTSQQAGPAVDDQYISNLVREELGKVEEQERARSLGDAYLWMEANHEDILENRVLKGTFGGLLDDKFEENPNADPVEVFKEAAEETRRIHGGGKAGPSNREARKAASSTHVPPGAGTGRAEATPPSTVYPTRTGMPPVSEAELDAKRREAMKREAERRGRPVEGSVNLHRG